MTSLRSFRLAAFTLVGLRLAGLGVAIKKGLVPVTGERLVRRQRGVHEGRDHGPGPFEVVVAEGAVVDLLGKVDAVQAAVDEQAPASSHGDPGVVEVGEADRVDDPDFDAQGRAIVGRRDVVRGQTELGHERGRIAAERDEVVSPAHSVNAFSVSQLHVYRLHRPPRCFRALGIRTAVISGLGFRFLGFSALDTGDVHTHRHGHGEVSVEVHEIELVETILDLNLFLEDSGRCCLAADDAGCLESREYG